MSEVLKMFNFDLFDGLLKKNFENGLISFCEQTRHNHDNMVG